MPSAPQSTTAYHYLLLYRTRLVAVNRIDETVVQDIPLPAQGASQPAGLALDEALPSLYLFTSAPALLLCSGHSRSRPMLSTGCQRSLLAPLLPAALGTGPLQHCPGDCTMGSCVLSRLE